MNLNHIKFRFILLLVIVGIILSPTTTLSFGTGASWNARSNINFSINPLIDSQLGVSNSSSWITSAASRWNGTTIFDFISQSWTGSGNFVGGASFVDNYPCSGTAYGMVANTCIIASPTMLSEARTYFNTNRNVVVWNINNINNSATTPKQQDVDSIMTHEFGHWMKLEHNLATSTMNLNGIAPRRDVLEDDKQGVTQLYGPYTGFDNSRATGLQNYSTFSSNVNGWSTNPSPELGVVPIDSSNNEFGVYPLYGNKMLRLAGNALTANSYIYFKLFSDDFNANAASGSSRGMTIQNGMHLKWCQYNFSLTTMSVDAFLVDSSGNISALRSNPYIVDQYGRRIGPAYRTDPTGSWYCYDVNLSPVAGQKVLHWYVGFDNALTGTSGMGGFRAYFDSLKIVWIGGKQ